MEIRALVPDDVPALWRINEEGVPGVGQITEAQMAALLGLTHLALGAIEDGALRAFVLCLRPGTTYSSLNYRWFQEHYPRFLYVDRIAVAAQHRNRQFGAKLYRRVIEQADQDACPVAAEVNVHPPNPGSMRFHARHGFAQVGALEHDYGSVAMLLRSPG